MFYLILAVIVLIFIFLIVNKIQKMSRIKLGFIVFMFLFLVCCGIVLNELFIWVSISFLLISITVVENNPPDKKEPTPEGYFIVTGSIFSTLFFAGCLLLAYFSGILWVLILQGVLFFLSVVLIMSYYHENTCPEPPTPVKMTFWERIKKRKEIKIEKENREKEKNERYAKIETLQIWIVILVAVEHLIIPLNIFLMWRIS